LIERQVRHMVRLVDDLLDVARITRGKVRLERQGIELASVVAKAIEMASPRLEQFRHRLVVEVPKEGLLVNVDETRFAQAIANLLTNAAKFTPPGGRIHVRAAREDERVILKVRDTRRGIAAELLPRIFDLFAQGRGPSPDESSGLGIGLTLVKSLVGMHGGEVSAYSVGPGQGSEFTLRVPISVDVRPAAVEPRRFPLRSLRPRRILVVDDNRDAADM